MARILIADDDPDVLELHRMVLEAQGHQVVLANGPFAALRRLERDGVDLIVMDLRFPDAAGHSDVREGLALIRGIACRAPVIVLSGWPDEIYGRPEERMVSRIMAKPVPPRDLLAAVAELTVE